MRVVSLILLLAIVGGVAFCFIHEPTRTKIKGWFFEAAHQAEGYSYAKSPKEAMENFEKAIKTRNFKAAARYVTEDYAKTLEKAHEAGHAVGTRLDKIYNTMTNKDLMTPMAVDLLINMDPFPDTFKIKGEVKETKKGETAEGQFEWVQKGKNVTGRDLDDPRRKNLDKKIYRVFNLYPKAFNKLVFDKVTIVFDKKNEAWKIDFSPRVDEADYFIAHYKRYETAYDSYINDLTTDRTVLLRDNADLELYSVMSRVAK